MYYRRDGTKMDDVREWSKLFRESDRRVADTLLPWGGRVSTVFLGLDFGSGDGPPLIFETIVFLSNQDFGSLDMGRYFTEDEAKAGHEAMVKKWENHKPEVKS